VTIKLPVGPAYTQLSQHDRDVVVAALKSGANRREIMG